MSTATTRSVVGFLIAALMAALLNLMPYLWTRGAYHGDGYEVIGFPFKFRRLGGFAGAYEFNTTALLADIALAIAVAVLVGYACSRGHRREAV